MSDHGSDDDDYSSISSEGTDRLVAVSRPNLEQRKCNDSYRQNWKRFCSWVDGQRASGDLPTGSRYLTCQNVDLYFHEKVAYFPNTPETCRQHVSSLQWFADQVEYAHLSRLRAHM